MLLYGSGLRLFECVRHQGNQFREARDPSEGGKGNKDLATRNPSVRIKRPSIPTLWIDTAVAVNLALARVPRCAELQSVLRDLVRKRKLLCPTSEQWEEFDGKKIQREAFEVLERLSLGVHLRHRGGIADKLTYAAMKAYVAGDDVIDAPIEIFFHEDPVEELNEALRRPFIISVRPFTAPEIIERCRSGKDRMHEEWQKLRAKLLAEGATYEHSYSGESAGTSLM